MEKFYQLTRWQFLIIHNSMSSFIGILVLVNYISICIFFPSVVVTYHYFWQDCKVSCQSSKKQDLQTDDEHESARLQKKSKSIKPIGELFKSVVSWFEGPFVDYVIMHPILRWIILATFVCSSVVFMSFAVQLRPDEEQVNQNW